MTRSTPATAFLALAILAAASGGAVAGDYPAAVKKAVNSITGREVLTHVEVMASDAYEGREAGTRGAFLTACYIASEFERYGLKPGGDDGTWFQTFALQGGGGGAAGDVAGANVLEILLEGRSLQVAHGAYGKDFLPLSFSATGYVRAPAVFAGYGISAAEYRYDDYAGLDVKGKIVVLLSHEPQEADPDSVFQGAELTPHGDPFRKASLAQEKGAAAVLIVLNPVHHADAVLKSEGTSAWPPAEGGPRLKIPCAGCTAEGLDRLFRAERKDLEKLQQGIDRGLKPASLVFKKSTMSLRVEATPDPAGRGRNVVGVWEGTDPVLKEECVVIGAHFDHIGLGHFASRGKAGQVHNGANDNASGTAGVLALARSIAQNGVAPRRTLIFAAFDGEEKGLLGSKHYVGRPAAPLERTVAMLNLDMIGRGPVNKIKVGGGTLNRTLQIILTRISARFRLGLDLDGVDAFLRNSDQAPFMDKGIPCIFLSSGLYNGLHSEEDDAGLLNPVKLEAIVRTMMLVAAEVADLEERP